MPRNREYRFKGIPDDFAEMVGDLAENPAYLKAWEHADKLGNPPKACMIYAENHWQEYEDDSAPTPESIQAEIERLEKQKELLEGNAS